MAKELKKNEMTIGGVVSAFANQSTGVMAFHGDSDILMNQRKVKLCKEKNCKDPQTTAGYCRMHYLRNWKQIKEKQKKKAVENLNKYIDHIMSKNPDGYVDAIREDLRNFGQFTRKADSYFADDEYNDVMEEMGAEDVERIIDTLKIDDTY